MSDSKQNLQQPIVYLRNVSWTISSNPREYAKVAGLTTCDPIDTVWNTPIFQTSADSFDIYVSIDKTQNYFTTINISSEKNTIITVGTLLTAIYNFYNNPISDEDLKRNADTFTHPDSYINIVSEQRKEGIYKEWFEFLDEQSEFLYLIISDTMVGRQISIVLR